VETTEPVVQETVDTRVEESMQLVSLRNGQIITDSRVVARMFEKLHKNVIQSIEYIECSDEFKRLNIQPSSYTSTQGKKCKQYILTRDGFIFLVSAFTGSKASR
jgi:Rha family phage regulatory protein